MANLNYMCVGTNKLDQAKAFYDELLKSIGWTKAIDHPSGGRIYLNNGQMFGVLPPYDGEAATVGNGSMCAFNFDSTEEIAAFHKKAIDLGATSEGDPGERAPNMYFSYFRDLDGNKICGYKISR